MIEPFPEPAVRVENLSITFPNGNGGLHTLHDISFEIAPQEFVCVLGPSGSGKSTLLRILAGLLKPTSGRVTFTDCNQGGEKPCVGIVFQQANLMPWRTALENITLPLELKGASLAQAQTRAREFIALVGLQGFENSWPRDLSGGMAQRVALARAMIQDPDLLLLDEPFGSLDALTRERMEEELLNLWQARRTTVIMVTHSISEALLLSDRVLVFTPRPGSICMNLKVDLERPRSEDMRYTQKFGDLSRQLRAAITQMGDVVK
jgi:NitT/TauT family transport system ATP-binding protein